MTAFYLVGFIQSLFVSSLILLKKNKVLSDYVLAFYIWVIGFYLFFSYSDITGLLDKNPFIIVLDILYWTFIGPSLFIYIDLITTNNKKFKLIHLIHLVPTLIVFIGLSEFFFQDEVASIFQYQSESFSFKLAFIVWMYNSPIYYLLCLFLLYRHRSRIKTYYSSSKNVDLKWLYYLVHGFAAYLLFGLLTVFLHSYFNIQFSFTSQHYAWLVLVIYIFGMGYFGYRQKGLFLAEEPVQSEIRNFDSAVYTNKTSYQKSGLSESESQTLGEQLQNFMLNEKPYLNCDLNLRDLAIQLSISPHKLSQVINDQMNCNFYEYVNAFRVEDVKNALVSSQNKHLKIMAIAYDCGFNSKSAFYTVFKKHTAQTPSAYREEHLIVDVSS